MSLILDGTNGLSDVDGSAATPAIRGSDANTGIFFPGADRIGFAEGGVQVGEFDASGNFLMNSGYGSAAVAYGCRAWVNFNGTGTPAIRASGNVSSITDNGTGDYTVNFTTAMPDVNYCIMRSTSSNSGSPDFYPPADLGTITASSVRFITGYITNFTADGIAFDLNNIHVAIFR
jgi:hypothetical protein